MSNGNLIMMLHAHLPYVRHPEHETHVEEMWLFEAISETYLPLLRMFDSLERDGVDFRLAMSISPTLATMLQDELMHERYIAYLHRQIELADREVNRTRNDDRFRPLAEMYRSRYHENLSDFTEKYENDIVRGFDYYYKRGKLEIVASSATHAFLPLYMQHPPAVRAQVQTGVSENTRVFGKAPRGFWLPECGYASGLEEYLADQGIQYFFVATHGLVFAEQRPAAGVYRPAICPNGVAVFARDHVSANAIWSAEDGYPSDGIYRDFYRDIGHDLPLDYIGQYLPEHTIRINTGFKYHAVTGRTNDKLPYDPASASRRVREHAAQFVAKLSERIRKLGGLMSAPPVVTCPFDAELFGHWWYEGPAWLEATIRLIAESEIALTSPSEYLKSFAPDEVTKPAFSSWGNKGYSEVWLDGSNDWVYRHTHKALERMSELIERFPNESGLKRRALNQAARETLLSQASDWPFIMRAGTAVPYAVRRVKDHVANVAHVYEALSRGAIGTEWLTRVEKQHRIFPDIDYRVLAWTDQQSIFSVPVPTIQ